MESVGAEIVRETTGATDAGYCDDLLRRYLFIAQDALHGGEYAMIPASGTPSGFIARVVIEYEMALREFP